MHRTTATKPDTAAKPSDGPQDEAVPHRETLDELRVRCFHVSIALIVVSGLALVSFWVAYIWTLALIAFATSLGIIGILHFQSMDALEHNECCCSPLPMVNTFGWMGIVVIVGGGLSFLSHMIAAIFHQKNGEATFAFFAFVGLITSALFVVVGLFTFVYGRRLHAACKELETMREPQWEAKDHEQPAGGPVAGIPVEPDSHNAQPSPNSGRNPAR